MHKGALYEWVKILKQTGLQRISNANTAFLSISKDPIKKRLVDRLLKRKNRTKSTTIKAAP